jgi:hypothetical protein
MFVFHKSSSSDKTAEIMAVQISCSASTATTGYGCKNLILPLFLSFYACRGLCVIVRVAFKQNILYNYYTCEFFNQKAVDKKPLRVTT